MKGSIPIKSRTVIIERTLLVMFCLATAGLFLLLLLGGPAWAVDALIGIAFLLAAPISFLAIRKKWRKGG